MNPAAAALAFASLLVIVNPVALAPVFAELTRGMPPARVRRTALVAVAAGFGLIGAAGFAGHWVLQLIGAEMALVHLVVAAGLLVMGAAMLLGGFGLGALGGAGRRDPALAPLAVPLIAGPGALGAMVMLTGRYAGDAASLALLYALLAGVAALTFAAFESAEAIAARLGDRGVRLITRALGLVLVGVAAKFVFEGLRAYGVLAK